MGTVGNLAGLNASALHCTIQKCLGATCLCAELGDLHAVSPRSTNFTMRKRGAVHALMPQDRPSLDLSAQYLSVRCRYMAFQYPDSHVHGDDIVFVSRTALGD